MNFLELKFENKTYINQKQIIDILKSECFYWLIDSEVSDAIIEIKNNTLIWEDGVYISGDWKYGIFKDGEFYGVWENGIWENGNFNGNWKSGIREDKLI